MLDVASKLCSLHAQVMSSAELTLLARVDGLGPDAVKKALWRDRSLVKLRAMRGTLHLQTSADYPMYQAALSTYAHFRKASWSRDFGVSQRASDGLIAAGEALYEGELTREELAVEVVRRTRSKRFGEALRESWEGCSKPCSFQAVLCFAPGEGQRVRFTNPRSWLGGDQSGPPANEALREVVRRFLVTHGPTSRGEVTRWWAGSFSPASAEKLTRSIGDEVTLVGIEGTEAWALTEHLEGIRSAEPAQVVRLLPAFDQYVIGSTKHAVDLLPGDFRDRVHRKAGWVRRSWSWTAGSKASGATRGAGNAYR